MNDIFIKQSQYSFHTVSHLTLQYIYKNLLKFEMNQSFKKVSKEVNSYYPEEFISEEKISQSILQKYLSVGNDYQDFFQQKIKLIQPYWSITMSQFSSNLTSIFTSHWTFNEQNKSIYLIFWGPLSLIFFCHLFHSQPYESNLEILYPGFIDLGVILIAGFALYVYSNVMNFPHNHYIQHVCISSHVNLFAIIYGSISQAAPQFLLISMSVLYACVCIYFHFNIYNKAIKPTLFQFIILLFIVSVFYSCATILYIQIFEETIISENTEHNQILIHDHFHERHFGQI